MTKITFITSFLLHFDGSEKKKNVSEKIIDCYQNVLFKRLTERKIN